MACVITLLVIFCYACHLVFWMGLLHTPRVCMGVTLLDVFLVGQLWSDQITLVHSPHPKIHHRDYIDGAPLNAKVSGA